MCHYKINNKENTELVSESRILHIHKIMYSAQKNGKKGKKLLFSLCFSLNLPDL